MYSACICMGTQSALTTESLDGYLPNLEGIKYSCTRTIVLTFGPNRSRGGSRLGPKIGQGGPLLQRTSS